MRLSPTPNGIGVGLCRGACYRELRRILLPGTSVNKGKKKGRSYDARPFS
jgi:hypothetical protein